MQPRDELSWKTKSDIFSDSLQFPVPFKHCCLAELDLVMKSYRKPGRKVTGNQGKSPKYSRARKFDFCHIYTH